MNLAALQPLVLLASLGAGAGQPPPEISLEVPPVAPVESGWDFTIEPFIWIAALDGDQSADSGPTVNTDGVGSLDAGFLLAAEAAPRDGGIGVLADGFFVRFTDEDGNLNSTTTAYMAEAGISWPTNADRSVEILAGLRYVDINLDVEVGGVPSGSARAQWVDPWIGARGEMRFNDTWSGGLRGDIGGFGVGSDFSWQAIARISAKLSDHVRLDLAYRALAVDFSDDDLTYDTIAHGPIIGVAIGL